jgi:TMEM175 potassium channel family protein
MSQTPANQRSQAMASHQEQAQELLERRRDPGRVMALTDGVFAIIMTLLVLEIHVPQLAAGESLSSAFLLEVWPTIVVFVISFVLTGLYWVGHRDMFNLVRGVDRGLIWLNILYMLPVALVPAAAALLGAYSRDPLALRLYGLLLLLISLMRLVLWYYIGTRRHLLIEHVPSRTLWTGTFTQIALILVFLIAILCAGFAPSLSLGIYAGVPLLYFIGITFVRRAAPQGSLERDFT